MAKKIIETPEPAATPAPFKRPRIEVLERRLQSPHGAPSAKIVLKEAGWSVRWFNSAVGTDHIWRAKENGWQGVTPAELSDPDQVGGFTVSPDGYVVRGDKGQELLMKLPTDWREQIAKKKEEQNTRAMRMGTTKSEVASAAGREFGDQAGEFINQNVSLVGDVRDSVERIHRERDE